MKEILIEFKKKLGKNGITVKWFIEKYLPDYEYHRAYMFLHGYRKTLPDEVVKAINAYLDK